jgi:hypothetical protein
MKPIPAIFDDVPVQNRRRFKVPPGAICRTVTSLCKQAGIPVNATTVRPVYIYLGKQKIRTPECDLVGISENPRSRVGALRALEALAFSFFDPCARFCVCKRGFFVVTPPTRP